MSYSDIIKVYSYNNYYCNSTMNDKNFIDGHKIMIELYRDSTLLTLKGKEITWILKENIAHLDYIRFNDSFRNSGILSELHKNCISIMNDSVDISKITLKPLTDVVTLWLYLGFEFERSSEKDNFIITLIDWIDENEIPYEIENIENDKLLDTIKNLKQYLFLYSFPKAIKHYISNLYKGVA